MSVSEIVLSPESVFFDDFAPFGPHPWVSNPQVGSLPAPQNRNPEADVPNSGASMLLWNKIPSELPTGFFKPGKFQSPTLEQPPDGATAQNRP